MHYKPILFFFQLVNLVLAKLLYRHRKITLSILTRLQIGRSLFTQGRKRHIDIRTGNPGQLGGLISGQLSILQKTLIDCGFLSCQIKFHQMFLKLFFAHFLSLVALYSTTIVGSP